MAGDATKTLSNDVLWGGGRSPFSISYGKMMMWFFLVSDALTFSGLLVAVLSTLFFLFGLRRYQSASS